MSALEIRHAIIAYMLFTIDNEKSSSNFITRCKIYALDSNDTALENAYNFTFDSVESAMFTEFEQIVYDACRLFS